MPGKPRSALHLGWEDLTETIAFERVYKVSMCPLLAPRWGQGRDPHSPVWSLASPPVRLRVRVVIFSYKRGFAVNSKTRGHVDHSYVPAPPPPSPCLVHGPWEALWSPRGVCRFRMWSELGRPQPALVFQGPGSTDPPEHG